MAEDTLQPDASSISVSYSKCLELYQNFLHLLGTESCRVVCLKQVNLGEVLEEYGRFRVWGEQTRATLPERTRGSLDDAIRNDDGLKGAVNSILEQLCQLLTMAIPIARKQDDDTAQDSESSMSADSDFDSDSQMESDGDSDGNGHIPNRHPSRVSKISILMRHTFEQIRLLYDMSALLNRPGLSRRYLRSSSKNEENLILSHFAEFDYEHIREKLQYWKGELKIIMDEEREKEPATTAENIKERKNTVPSPSDETEILCRRLALSNTKRRDQLRYWTSHPDRPDGVQSRNATDARNFNDGQTKAKSTTVKSQTSTVKPAEQNTIPDSNASKSITSKQSFSMGTVSDVFHNQTTLRSRTIYAESTVGNKTSNRVPDVPKATKISPTFKCPYCNLTLDSVVMANRLNWKRHVFSDLRPYVCTFVDCLNPQKQYHVRHDWIYHEQQMHRRQWVCSGDCNQKFSTKDLMIDHLHNVHPRSLAQHQLSTLIEMSERPIDGDEILACPLCPDKLSLGKLQTHLAEHLETISLFVLPNEVDENEIIDSDKVAATRSKLDQDQDEMATQATLSSLVFSETYSMGQTKEDFSKLLLMEEAGVELKFEVWEADEAISAATHEPKITDDYVEFESFLGSGLGPSQKDLPGNQGALTIQQEDLLTRIDSLTLTCQNQGRWKEAEELLVEAVETRNMLLGRKHIDTMDSMSSLAATYRRQGRWKDAEEVYLGVLPPKREVLGVEHPSTLRTATNLGDIYKEQGKLAEAEEMYQQVLQGYNNANWAEHPSKLTTINKIGDIYKEKGKLYGAEEMYHQALQGYRNALGVEHPSTLRTATNLGDIYKKQGRLAEAEDMYRQALQGYRNALGVDHPSTLNTVNNLGDICIEQGKIAEAEEMYQQLLNMSMNGTNLPCIFRYITDCEHTNFDDPYSWSEHVIGHFGPSGPPPYALCIFCDRSFNGEDVMVCWDEFLEHVKGHFESGTALEASRPVFGVLKYMLDNGIITEEDYRFFCRKNALGVELPSTLSTVNNLEDIYKEQGKLSKKELMNYQALQGYKNALGVEHPSTLSTANSLGGIYKEQGKLAEAEEVYQQTPLQRHNAPRPLRLTRRPGTKPIDPQKYKETREKLRQYRMAVFGEGIDAQARLEPSSPLKPTQSSQGSLSSASKTVPPALAEASSTTSDTDFAVEFSQDENPLLEPTRKALSPEKRAREALLRCLGSCLGDCRERKVECSLSHHSLEDILDGTHDDETPDEIRWALDYDSLVATGFDPLSGGRAVERDGMTEEQPPPLLPGRGVVDETHRLDIFKVPDILYPSMINEEDFADFEEQPPILQGHGIDDVTDGLDIPTALHHKNLSTINEDAEQPSILQGPGSDDVANKLDTPRSLDHENPDTIIEDAEQPSPSNPVYN